jgi:tetratricopeptide (TPR) repeat protein
VATVAGNWIVSGRVTDGIYWTEQAIKHGAGDNPDLASCMALLSNGMRFRGEHERSHELATKSVEMLRRLGDQKGLPFALRTLAVSSWERDEIAETRALYEEAIAASRATGNVFQLHRALSEMATFESDQGDLEHCRPLEEEALALAIESNDPASEVGYRQNLACTLRMLGHVDDAEAALNALLPAALAIHEDTDLISIVEDYAAVLAERGQDDQAVARLMGAADAWHEEEKSPRSSIQEHEIADSIGRSRARLSTKEWQQAHREGGDQGIDVVLAAFIR